MSTQPYQEWRRSSHDCTRFVIPAKFIEDAPCTTTSNLRALPNELLLYLKNFLNFKDRCCLALTEKHFAATMLDKCPTNPLLLQIPNTERKELEVHPMQDKRTTAQPPPKICTHICGEYNELLRILAKEWCSDPASPWKLCVACRAFRPSRQDYWNGRALPLKPDAEANVRGGAQSADRWVYLHFVQRCKEWCEGEENRCPDCTSNPCFWPTGVRDVDFIEPQPW